MSHSAKQEHMDEKQKFKSAYKREDNAQAVQCKIWSEFWAMLDWVLWLEFQVFTHCREGKKQWEQAYLQLKTSQIRPPEISSHSLCDNVSGGLIWVLLDNHLTFIWVLMENRSNFIKQTSNNISFLCFAVCPPFCFDYLFSLHSPVTLFCVYLIAAVRIRSRAQTGFFSCLLGKR